MRAPALENDGMGSLLTGEGCRFRVWAPNAERVQLVLDAANNAPAGDLAAEPGTGNWSADQVDAPAGTKYQYIVTNMGGANNDNSQPWFRTDARAQQVESSAGASMGYVVDPGVFTNGRQPFTTPAFEDFLIYQLHIGSFAGHNDGIGVTGNIATFVDIIAKLDYVRGLGFNAIEPLPITDFRCDVGGAGEGYGPSDLFASEDAYATSPDRAVAELIQLIDAAHSKGLAVILDMVYNHAGTNDNRYWRYDGNTAGDNGLNGGIYFVHGHPTPWGAGFAVWQKEVKDLLLDNARMYLRDYRVDGLRDSSGCGRVYCADAPGGVPRQVSDRRVQPKRREHVGRGAGGSLWHSWLLRYMEHEQPRGHLRTVEWNGRGESAAGEDRQLLRSESMAPGELLDGIAR
jgi:1,4-alpha-glucan branching enzyme